jgi:predicted MFS family arabinose efflux permease
MRRMSILARIVPRIIGGTPDRDLHSTLAVGFLSSASLSALWGFQGLWAIESLGASSSALGVALAAAACLGATASYVGGHVSDRIGRKPVILAAWAAQTVVLSAIALTEPGLDAGLVMMVAAGTLGAPSWSALQALVADLVPRERHEAGFSAIRVAQNLGVCTGPPMAGLLLINDDWRALFTGIAVLLGITTLIAARSIPAEPTHAADAAAERPPARVMLRDRPFLLFLSCSVLAAISFVASESVMPIAAVSLYGLTPTQWGLMFVLNPIAVVLFQMRLSRRVEHIPATHKLVASMLLMGLPFLLLPVNHTLPALIFVICVFVVGEMLWVPTSQGIVAAMAPPHLRGAYMGAVAGTSSVAFALGPLIALHLLDLSGDTAMWSFLAGCMLLAALAGTAAIRHARPRAKVGLQEAAQRSVVALGERGAADVAGGAVPAVVDDDPVTAEPL